MGSKSLQYLKINQCNPQYKTKEEKSQYQLKQQTHWEGLPGGFQW